MSKYNVRAWVLLNAPDYYDRKNDHPIISETDDLDEAKRAADAYVAKGSLRCAFVVQPAIWSGANYDYAVDAEPRAKPTPEQFVNKARVNGRALRKAYGALTRRQQEARQIANIRTHDCKASGCGAVCTFGDW